MSGPHYLTTEIENTENTPEQRAAAARTVARHTSDAGDCRELLEMLGLLSAPAPARGPEPAPPVQEFKSNTGRCGSCRCATYSDKEWAAFGKDKPAGARAYGGRGLCNSCHRAALREEQPRTDLIDAAETIEHILALRAAKVPWKQIDAAAEVLEGTAHRLAYRRQVRVKAGIAAAIMAVPVPQVVAA
ncbi:hypothetical protein [Nocardia sp. NPDC003963]